MDRPFDEGHIYSSRGAEDYSLGRARDTERLIASIRRAALLAMTPEGGSRAHSHVCAQSPDPRLRGRAEVPPYDGSGMNSVSPGTGPNGRTSNPPWPARCAPGCEETKFHQM